MFSSCYATSPALIKVMHALGLRFFISKTPQKAREETPQVLCPEEGKDGMDPGTCPNQVQRCATCRKRMSFEPKGGKPSCVPTCESRLFLAATGELEGGIVRGLETCVCLQDQHCEADSLVSCRCSVVIGDQLSAKFLLTIPAKTSTSGLGVLP